MRSATKGDKDTIALKRTFYSTVIPWYRHFSRIDDSYSFTSNPAGNWASRKQVAITEVASLGERRTFYVCVRRISDVCV